MESRCGRFTRESYRRANEFFKEANGLPNKRSTTPESAPVVKLNTALHEKLISEGTFKPTSLEAFRAKIRSLRVG